MVELIVVITILAILATVGYISFLGYASAARDSARVNNISVITRAIEYSKLKDTILFQPDNMIAITLSGAVVGYQGDIGELSLGKIGITEGQTDPLDGEYYSYFLSGNKAQILTMLENPRAEVLGNIVNSSYAATDYTSRYPYFKGYGLGMLLEEDNTPIHRSPDVIAEGEFDVFNTLFSVKRVKSLYSNLSVNTMPALLIGGQLSLNSQTRNTSECPEHFIPVPGNSDVGQPDFCIGKYEATIQGSSATGAYKTLPGVVPLTNISNFGTPLKIDCRGNGENYHMMTIMEWLTIARNIERVDSNWSNGLVGSGYIIGGNNGNTTTGFSEGRILNTGPSGNVIQDNLRKLTLSNGEKINDFIGNVWEVVKPLNLYNIPSTGNGEVIESLLSDSIINDALDLFSVSGIPSINIYYSWTDVPDINYRNMYGPTVSLEREQGVGTFRQRGNYTTFIGGDYNESSPYENGLYSIARNTLVTSGNIGTRCAYSY